MIFKIRARSSVAIRDFSYYPFEEELLLRPNTVLRVVRLLEPTSFNLSSGVANASEGSFACDTDHLGFTELSLDAARQCHKILIELHEEPVHEIDSVQPAAHPAASVRAPTQPPSRPSVVDLTPPAGDAKPRPSVPESEPLGPKDEAPSPPLPPPLDSQRSPPLIEVQNATKPAATAAPPDDHAVPADGAPSSSGPPEIWHPPLSSNEDPTQFLEC